MHVADHISITPLLEPFSPADPVAYARACQAIVEQDFLQRLSAHIDCDYESTETALDSLGANVLGLVNSPNGRAVLAHALTRSGTPLLISSIH